MEAVARNGHDAGEAIRELRNQIREADTVPDLPEDAEVRTLALAYANVAAAQHERVRLFIGCLDALHRDNVDLDEKLGKAILKLKLEIAQHRTEAKTWQADFCGRLRKLEEEFSREREDAKRRHEEVCALLKNLRGYA